MFTGVFNEKLIWLSASKSTMDAKFFAFFLLLAKIIQTHSKYNLKIRYSVRNFS